VSGADSRRENRVREKGEERECGFDRDGIEEEVTLLNETMKIVKPGRTVILFHETCDNFLPELDV